MPTLYPPGRYDAEVLRQDFDEADTGTQFFYLECRILCKHQFGGQSAYGPQYTRTVRYYLTDAAAPILDEALAILGVTRTQIIPNTPAGTNPAWVNLAGRRVVLRCTHQTHGRDTHERWRLAHAWVTVHHVEVLLAREAVGTPGRVAVEKDLGRAEARLQAALKATAVLRRLRGPAVRLTQVNVAGAERVVVR